MIDSAMARRGGIPIARNSHLGTYYYFAEPTSKKMWPVDMLKTIKNDDGDTMRSVGMESDRRGEKGLRIGRGNTSFMPVGEFIVIGYNVNQYN